MPKLWVLHRSYKDLQLQSYPPRTANHQCTTSIQVLCAHYRSSLSNLLQGWASGMPAGLSGTSCHLQCTAWLIQPLSMLHHAPLSTLVESCVGGREIAVHLTAGSNTVLWQTSNSMEIACFQQENKGGWIWQVSPIISECYLSGVHAAQLSLAAVQSQPWTHLICKSFLQANEIAEIMLPTESVRTATLQPPWNIDPGPIHQVTSA